MDQKRGQDQQKQNQPGQGSQGLTQENDPGGGISNRGLDRELEEQAELPERGSEKSED